MIINYSTFTKHDPNGHLTVADYHLDFDAYMDEDCYLHKDYGANFFDDFAYRVNVKGTSLDGGDVGAFWMLSNDLDDMLGLWSSNKSFLALYFNGVKIYLKECYIGSDFTDFYTGAAGTWYYFTITKSGTSLIVEIYSDSARTNLLDTLSLTLHTDHKFRYLLGCNTYNGSLPAKVCTLDIENLYAFSLPIYTTPALVRKRIKDVDSGISDWDIFHYISEAEGVIDATMNDSFKSIFDPLKHGVIRTCATNLAAYNCLQYNPSQSLGLEATQLISNSLWKLKEYGLSLLSDSRVVTYLKGL